MADKGGLLDQAFTAYRPTDPKNAFRILKQAISLRPATLSPLGLNLMDLAELYDVEPELFPFEETLAAYDAAGDQVLLINKRIWPR